MRKGVTVEKVSVSDAKAINEQFLREGRGKAFEIFGGRPARVKPVPCTWDDMVSCDCSKSKWTQWQCRDYKAED